MTFAKSDSTSGNWLAKYLDAVNAALRVSDMAGAMRISEEAVTAGAEHPTLLSLAGLRRMGAGADESALPLLLRAREMAPREVRVLDALGQCLTRLGRAREALLVFDAALRQAPTDARLHFNKAMALEDLSALDLARQEFERAVDLQPSHTKALARLAILAAQRGDAKTARDLAGRALQLNPREAVARLALAISALEQKDFAAAEVHVHKLLQDPNLGPINRALAHGLAGDILDGQDRPTEAFNAYACAKATLRAAYAPGYAAAGESALAREQRLADYFRRAAPDAWRAAATSRPELRTHVFLVGFPRSGTTLLEQVIASHPDVEAMEERTCLVDSAVEFMGSDNGLDRLVALSDADCIPWRQAYWRRAEEAGQPLSHSVFLDKLPLNAVFLPLVAKLFPAAKILFALRDPRDVVLSCFRRRFGMNLGMYEFTTLNGTAAYYAAVMDLMEIYSEKLGLEICATRHESLVGDFEGETRRLCDFLELGFRAEMRGFAHGAAAQNIDTPSSAQVARGLSSTGVGQWRRYREQLAPILPMLAAFVTRFGYPET